MAKRGNPNWQKGVSANPGGRPKMSDDLREAIGAHTPRAIEVLAAIMNDPEAQPAARVRAAEIILKKAVPDLSTIDLTAEIENRPRYVIKDRMPTAEEWEAKYCQPEASH